MTQKFKRGQIWMVKESSDMSTLKVKLGYTTMAYSRPYLIISDDKEIEQSDKKLVCVPISSKLDYVVGNVAIFTNYDGERNKVCVSEIHTIDSFRFSHYMFTISDEIMNEIDIKIKRTLFGTEHTLKPKIEIKDIDISVKEISNDNESKPVKSSTASSVPTTEKQNSIYHRWTRDEMVEFCKKYNESLDDVCKEYGLTRQQAQRKYHYFRKEKKIEI